MKKHPGSKEMLLAVIAAQGLLILFHYGEALAMTAPSTGSFAYDVYDIGVNSILKGPIGFIGGVGASRLRSDRGHTGTDTGICPRHPGGAALLKADSIVQTLGCII